MTVLHRVADDKHTSAFFIFNYFLNIIQFVHADVCFEKAKVRFNMRK